MYKVAFCFLSSELISSMRVGKCLNLTNQSSEIEASTLPVLTGTIMANMSGIFWVVLIVLGNLVLLKTVEF